MGFMIQPFSPRLYGSNKQGNDDAASLPFARPPVADAPSPVFSAPAAVPPILPPTSHHPSSSAGPASNTRGAHCVEDGDQAI